MMYLNNGGPHIYIYIYIYMCMCEILKFYSFIRRNHLSMFEIIDKFPYAKTRLSLIRKSAQMCENETSGKQTHVVLLTLFYVCYLPHYITGLCIRV